MRDRVEIGVADITPAGVVPQRGLAGWMKAHRHAEPLDLGPQRLAGLVVQVLPIDRVRGADDRDRAQFGDAAPRLSDCARNVVHRDLASKFEPHRVMRAVIMGPVVAGARQRRRVIGRQVVVRQDLPAAGAVHDGDVYPLDVHRRQGRGGIETLRLCNLKVRMPGTAAPPQLAA